MKLRRIFGYGIMGIFILIVLLYGWECIRFIYTRPLVSLLTCADGVGYVPAWVCQQGIYHVRVTPNEVKELNEIGGVYLILNLKDKQVAEKVLQVFLARGVDINSSNNITKLRAFESAVISGDPANVNLLIKYGAKTDFRNDYNETMLELAKRLHKKYPRVGYEKVIAVLEDNEKQINPKP